MDTMARFNRLWERRSVERARLSKKYPLSLREWWCGIGITEKPKPVQEQEVMNNLAFAHLPEPLRFGIWVMKNYSRFPNKRGRTYEMGGYGSIFDQLGCVFMVVELIEKLSATDEQRRLALSAFGMLDESLQVFDETSKLLLIE